MFNPLLARERAYSKPRLGMAPLTLMVHVAIMAMATSTLMSTPVLAQGSSTAAVAAKRYDIPAGTMSSVLTRFAAQAGVALSFDPAWLAGLHSSGLQGNYSVEAGFDTLLSSAGFHAVRHNASEYTLKKIPHSQLNAAEKALPVINVAAVQADGITEATGAYTTRRMNSATRLGLSVRDTPQAVTVVTRQLMEDQRLQNLDDVVQATAGLFMTKSGPERPIYTARGYEVDNIMYDGLPTTSTYNNRDTIASPDMAMYDRVEIVRGATGLMQGAGNPAAAINLVRKRPASARQFSVQANAGSWNRYRSEIDASGALDDNGSLRARGVVAYQYGDSFQDVVRKKRSVVYGVLEADIARSTTVSLGVSNQIDRNRTGWGSIPVAPDGRDLGLPRHTYLSNNWDFWDQESTFVFATLEQRLANGWKIHVSANRIWGNMDYLASKPWYQNGQYDMTTGSYRYRDDQTSLDIYANGPFTLLGREHELVLGASQRRDVMDVSGGGDDIYFNMDLWQWNPGRVPKPTLAHWFFQTLTEQQKAVYATTRLNLGDRLKLIGGMRANWFDFDQKDFRSPASYKINRQLNKYAGLIYDLDAQHSVYVSYTDIFKPQNNRDMQANILAPMQGKNYEAGIKGEYLDGKLNASISVFRMNQINRAQLVPDTSVCPGGTLVPCYEAAGEVRSEGIDVDIQGELMPNWHASASYSYVDATYRKDKDASKVGQSFGTSMPRQLAKIGSTYRMPGAMSAWKVGGNVRWQSGIYNQGEVRGGSKYHIEQSAYAVVDVMLAYKASPNLDIQLNINNLFDKWYYQGITSTPVQGNSVYGDPRNMMLTARYSF